MPSGKKSSGSKTYGSSTQKCPAKGKKAGAIAVMVVDAKANPLFGLKVSATDSTPGTQTGNTADDGLVTLKPLVPGPVALELELDDNEKKLYLAPSRATGTAKTGAGGYHLFALRPLIKTIRPKITLGADRLEVNPKAKTSEPLEVKLVIDQNHPEVELAVDGKLTRSGPEIEIYTNAGCTAALGFAGDVATIPSAQLKAPKAFWIKGTALGRATLTLEGVPVSPGQMTLDVDDTVEGITLFAPDAVPRIDTLPSTFLPGGARTMTIDGHLTDADRVAKEGVLEVVDKDGAVAWTSAKLAFPGAHTQDGKHTFIWDGKKGNAAAPEDKSPYQARFSVTDKFDRKVSVEKPFEILKESTITTLFSYGRAAIDAGKDQEARSGIKVKVVETGGEATTDAGGKAVLGDLLPGTYTVTATIDPQGLGKSYELPETRKTVTVAKNSNADLPLEIETLATFKVTLKSGTKGIKDATIKLGLKAVAEKITGDDGTVDFGIMPDGDYSVDVEFPEDSDPAVTYQLPAATRVTLNRHEQLVHALTALELPPMSVTVKCPKPDRKLKDTTVKIKKGPTGKEITAKTDEHGKAAFPNVPIGGLEIRLEYSEQDAKDFELPADAVAYISTLGGPNEKVIDVEPKKCPVHLSLSVKLPDDTTHLLPKDYPVSLILDDDTAIVCKLNDKGALVDATDKPPKVPRIQKFTVELKKAADSYLVIEKAGDPATQELVVDATPKLGSTLFLAFDAGKRALLLPQLDLKLIRLDTEATPADHYTAPNFEFKDKELIGAEATPVKLVVKPKWQFVRFEYFDRRHGASDHAGKRVGIPSVLLRAARKTTAGNLGTVETAASFQLNPTDNATSCQALPWWIVKKVNGDAEDKLTKELHLEFGVEHGWIEAASATERKIVKLDPATPGDKLKIAAHKDRDKLYDLPAVWKSCFYYTRLSATTGKFFDELTETDLEGSYDKAKPLTFSLDDLVLTDKLGVQKVRDRNKTHAEIDRSKHSRFAILHHDATDGYELKVWEPRPDAVFHTNKLFTKEAAADVYRNYLIEYPLNPRVVVFCNGFHDVWNKRTVTGSYADKTVVGARAAQLEDADVSVKKIFNDAGDEAAGYVHRTRSFDSYYLHGGATDGKTVYSAIVSHLSVRAFSLDAQKTPGWNLTKKPLTNVAADARVYRSTGMKNAMERWNEKKYQLEQEDQGTDDVIKTFVLFEAKDIEEPLGTIVSTGGKHHAALGVCADSGRSSATDVTMYMRKSAYRDEGAGFGSMPSGSPVADYATGGKHRNALAHEMGHAVMGLWDDYITEKQYKLPSFQKVQRYPGVHLNRDAGSMMSVNQSVRLRTYWGRARWINTEAAASGALHKFLAAKKFVPTYAPPGKDKLVYSLPDLQASFWTPAKTADAVALGEEGRAALHLYAIGDDEFASMLPDGPYDAMVVIDTRIEVTYCPGMDPAPDDWTDGVTYTVGNVVDFEAEFYVCKETHPASADFATDAAKWQLIDPAKNYAWAAGDSLDPGDVLEDGGQSYVALTSHVAGSVIPEFWLAKGPDTGAWVPNGASYRQGELAEEGGTTYICLADNVSGAALDPASWLALGPDQGAYTDGTTYAVGDECQDGGDWVCLTEHEAGSAEADEKAGRLVKCDCEVDEWPDPNTSFAEHKLWLGDTNKAILKAMENTDLKGKFRFTRDGDAFSKIYVRAFPQYYDAETKKKTPPHTLIPATGGAPHFRLKVKKSDSKGFGASGQDISVSKNVDTNTLVGYLYGRLSDDSATRATQNPTAALTIANLAKVKEWIDGQIGGTAVKGEALPETPRITSLSPATGAAVGDTVTLTGERFTGATKVFFGATEQATITVVSATSVTAVVPAGATTGKVKITTPKGSGTSPQRYKILPKITALAPTTPVGPGTEITITGTNLAAPTGVKVNTKAATFTAVSATEVKAKIPVGASTGTVQVTTADGTATSTASITIVPPPTVTGFTPASARPGDEVTVTGTNLDSATEVKIGGAVAAVTSKTATEIKATVGDGAADGTVLVTTPGGAASKPGFTRAT